MGDKMLQITKRKKYKRKNNKYKNRIIGLAILSISIVISILILNIEGNLTFLELNGDESYSARLFKGKLEELENQININEVKYEFPKKLNENNKPNKIIVHHAVGSNITAEQINKMHIEKGFEGIGYHFYIRKDGTVYRGRPENTEGAHTIGENRTSLGICLEGNMDKETVSEKQMESLENLSEYLIIKYNLETIDGHNDHYNTRCPGENMSIEGLNERVKNRLIELANK